TAGYALETMHGLACEPFHDARSTVAICNVISQRGKTIWFAALLHFGQLFQVKFLIFDGAPVVMCVVHREAGCKRTVRADNQPVLPCAAAPMLSDSAHEAFHVLQASDGVHHLPPLALLVDKPVEKIVDHRKIVWANVRVVLMKMFEVALLHHGSFVD